MYKIIEIRYTDDLVKDIDKTIGQPTNLKDGMQTYKPNQIFLEERS